MLLETDFCYRRIRWSGSPLYVGDREGGGAEEGGGAAHSTFHARLVLNVTRMFYSRRRGLD